MSGPIPMLDLGDQTAELWPELEKAVLEVMRSGRFILGPNVEAFERETADFLGVAHAVGLGSGTDALTIGLRALGIGPGDEVIAPSFTFFATVETVSLLGATPVFADIDPHTFCLDPASVERAITRRTRAVVPVHLFGHAAPMAAIRALARRHGLAVLEDAAQAFGGSVTEGPGAARSIGSLGDAAALSFFPSKNLGAFGDGGMLATDDAGVARAARLLRGHGSVRRYEHEALGYTSRLDEIQAAILRVKLPHVRRWNEGRRRVAQVYDRAFADLTALATPAEVDCTHVYHQYTLRVAGGRRNALLGALAERGVTAVIYYPTPVHRCPMYDAPDEALPETLRAADEVLSLPIWPEMNAGTQGRVIDAVRDAVAQVC